MYLVSCKANAIVITHGFYDSMLYSPLNPANKDIATFEILSTILFLCCCVHIVNVVPENDVLLNDELNNLNMYAGDANQQRLYKRVICYVHWPISRFKECTRMRNIFSTAAIKCRCFVSDCQ